MNYIYSLLLLVVVQGLVLAKAEGYSSPTIAEADSIPFVCGQQEMWDDFLELHPEARKRQREWEQERMERAATTKSSARRRTAYEIPVVVHIIHSNGSENISDAEVAQGIQYLNEGFSASGPYGGMAGADTELTFRLAERDPNNNPTLGINRVVSGLTEMLKSQDLDVKNLIRWDPTCYVNIWLVREICKTPGDCGVAGYAYFPSAHGMDVDGIMMEARHFASSPEGAVVTIHELGHYFGLYHTFEGGCKNDDCLADGDRVCDTPPDQSTARVDCAVGANSCSTDVNASDPNNLFTVDENDQMENFMDYASCSVLFTEGQKTRMVDALENVRFSLVDLARCPVFCSSPVTANFTASATEILAGGTVTFTDLSSGAANSAWTINGVPFSGTSFTFNDIGSFLVQLQITGTDQACRDEFSLNITVNCPVEADFTVSATQVALNEIVNFVNTSTNAASYEWTVNNVVTSSAANFDFSSATPGIYTICLVAENALCQDRKCQRILVTEDSPCTGPNCEDCSNGIDDDGDGLIDFFDDDCPCIADANCGAPFYSPCAENCEAPEPISPMSLDIDFTIHPSYAGVVFSAADFDGDCQTEVAMIAVNRRSVTITGLAGQEYIFNNQTHLLFQIAAGDVDNDGAAEIFIVASTRGTGRPYFIWRLDYNFALDLFEKTWESSQSIETLNNNRLPYRYTPSIADFNYDGRPEVYIGNQIFDSETGLLLAEAGPTFNVGAIFSGGERRGSFSSAVAVDMLSDSECIDCAGLELVAGNQVFSVNLTSTTNSTLNSVQVVRELPGFEDGATAVADFDMDGDVDVIVANLTGTTRPGRLYIWDGQTAAQIGQSLDDDFSTAHGASVPSIGDLDGDGRPEIVINGGRRIRSYHDYQTGGGVNWGANRFTTTIGSYRLMDHHVANTLFDFNLDGKQEIVMRDQFGFYIFDGEMNLLAGVDDLDNTTSMTDKPLILDWDEDGEAEILTPWCFDSLANPICTTRLVIINSAGEPWSNTRKIQNQQTYFNANINDNGTIPIQQQNPHLLNDPALNSYNQQYAIPSTIGTEATSEILNASCSVDGIEVEFEICNDGDLSLPANTPIAIYDGNPTATNAPLLTTFALPSELFPNECITLTDTVLANQDSVFVVVNDDGSLPRPYLLTGTFPPTNLQECDYTDNLSGIVVPRGNPPNLDLGPDILICDNGIFVLDAGPGFTTYRWSDESFEQQLTAFEPGRYWVETTDLCGAVQSDTLVITIDPLTQVSLGTDLNVCAGDTIQFDAGVFDQYNWLPRSTSVCDTCRLYSLNVSQDTQVIVQVQSDLGCISLDTVDVTLASAQIGFDSISICSGDSILINGISIFSDTLITQRFNTATSCDSILTTKVIVSDSIFVTEQIERCAGDTLIVFGTAITRDSTLFEAYTSVFGCDSIYEVSVQFRPLLTGTELLTFCEGDTAMVFGNQVNESGTFSEILSTLDGCDSLVTIEVFFNPTIETFERLEYCLGDTVSLFGTVLTENGSVSQSLTSAVGCDSIHNIEVVFVAEIEQILFDSACTGDFLLFFNDTISETGTYVKTVESITGDCDTNYVMTAEFFEDPMVELVADTLIGLGETIELPLNLFDPTDQVTWVSNPLLSCENCPNPTVTITEETSFEATVTNSRGCTVTARINLRVFDEAGLYVPTAFSPNDDFINDVFTIYFRDPQQVNELQIYSRWGELVFELNDFMSNELTIGWDGTAKDMPVDPGVFVYQFLIRNDQGELETIAGDVTVMR